MHELTCTCHACCVIRSYLNHFKCGGPAGHPIACVCPQCSYTRELMRRFPLGTPMGTLEPAREFSPLPPGRAEPVTLEVALGFTVREGDTR